MLTETFPNPDVMGFHLKKRLTDASIRTFHSKDWKRIEEGDLKSGGLHAAIIRILFGRSMREFFEEEVEEKRQMTFIDDLFNIDGITDITVLQYSIHVHKAKAYIWEELQPKIEEVLRKHNLE